VQKITGIIRGKITLYLRRVAFFIGNRQRQTDRQTDRERERERERERDECKENEENRGRQ